MFMVTVEAKAVSSDIEHEAESMVTQLEEAAEEMKPEVAVDEKNNMVLTVLRLEDEDDAISALRRGLDVWTEMSEELFPESPAREAFALRATRGGSLNGAASVPAETAETEEEDPNADLDEELGLI